MILIKSQKVKKIISAWLQCRKFKRKLQFSQPIENYIVYKIIYFSNFCVLFI